MKLVNFSVTNFRSITSAHKVPISETTVLIGKNNEGKSNILKALSMAMRSLQEHAHKARHRIVRRYYHKKNEKSYYWERDFPIALRQRKGAKQSIFRLEFLLNDSEIIEFKNEIKSNLNGTLPLVLKYGEDNRPVIRIAKTGRGSKTLNSKSARIANFIATKLSFNYIPAVRTDKEAMTVIEDMLQQELRFLEKNKDYKAALQVISDLQTPILTDLAKRLKEPLSEFLPNIKNVEISFAEDSRRMPYRRAFEVVIDDGTPTNIEFKGDGVKSLAALGLLKNKKIESGVSVIAIEEPESHLHPSAIHQLNEIITSLSETNQVIISSHNPLFVDRLDIKSNVIIENGKAAPAKNIKQIRNLLGIKASDNLMNANFALIVEGEDDHISLKALLSTLSGKIAKALRSNILAIDPIGGAGNLPYKLSLIKNSLCVYHVVLDNDEAGRTSFEKAKVDGLLNIKNCTFTTCRGMLDSEFEDCLDQKIYQQRILDDFGVDLSSTKFRGSGKWSDRMKNVFMDQGKPWGDIVKNEVKQVVADCVSLAPKEALHPLKRNSIDALISELELLF